MAVVNFHDNQSAICCLNAVARSSVRIIPVLDAAVVLAACVCAAYLLPLVNVFTAM